MAREEKDMVYFAQCAPNTPDLVAKEAEEAGAEKIFQTHSGVQFAGSLEVGYRFCMTSRVASRLLLALCFDENINSADELYESALTIQWEKYLKEGQTFQITNTVQMCPWLKNSHFAALRVKDAICDRFREKFDDTRPNVDTENPDVTFHVHVRGSRVLIYVDFSGEGLFKRGYRSESIEANMKESLAAAVLMRSDWHKCLLEGTPKALLDPFAGTGTIPIEAALMAYDIAPGLLRGESYAFEKLYNFDAEAYNKVLDEISDKAEKAKDRKVEIYASDISKGAIEVAKACALKAGVYDSISFIVKDFTTYSKDDCPADDGYIVTRHTE